MTKFDHFAERGLLKKYAAAINDLREDIKSHRIASGLGYKVKRTASGTILQIQPGSKTTTTTNNIRRFQIIDVKPTYLECYPTNDDNTDFESTTIVKVLRPTCTAWNNTSTGMFSGWNYYDNDTERGLMRVLKKTDRDINLIFRFNQTIFPIYTGSPAFGQGDWIFAVEDPKGFYAADGTEEIHWVDLNVDARHWACTEPQRIAVCVDGVTQYMYVIATPIGIRP
jgi:hypothetical protein